MFDKKDQVILGVLIGGMIVCGAVGIYAKIRASYYQGRIDAINDLMKKVKTLQDDLWVEHVLKDIKKEA